MDRLTCTAALGCMVQKQLQALELESSLTKIWPESKEIFFFLNFSSNFEMIVNLMHLQKCEASKHKGRMCNI